MEDIAKGVVILDARMRAEASIGVAAGVEAALGGKGRLMGHARGGLLFEADIMAEVQEVIQEGWKAFNEEFFLRHPNRFYGGN